MTKIYIEYDYYCEHSEYSEEEYGPWSQQNSFSVGGASITPKNCYEEFNLCCNVEVGQPVYAMVLRYGTGDSFGNSSGNGEILWVWREKILAEKALEWFNENLEKHTINFFQEDLTEVQISNPASGYFEWVEDVYIQELILEE